MANIEHLRRVYVPDTRKIKSFVSGYSNSVIPNLWDRSAEMRAYQPSQTGGDTTQRRTRP